MTAMKSYESCARERVCVCHTRARWRGIETGTFLGLHFDCRVIPSPLIDGAASGSWWAAEADALGAALGGVHGSLSHSRDLPVSWMQTEVRLASDFLRFSRLVCWLTWAALGGLTLPAPCIGRGVNSLWIMSARRCSQATRVIRHGRGTARSPRHTPFRGEAYRSVSSTLGSPSAVRYSER